MNRDCSFAVRLSDQAREHPDRIALREPGRGIRRRSSRWADITFEQLSALASNFAHGFAREGVQRGDRVLLMIRPSIQSTAVYFGLLRLGAIPVLIDPGMGLRRLLGCVETIEPRIVIAVPAFLRLLGLSRRAFSSVAVKITDGRRWFRMGPSLASCAAGGVGGPFEKVDSEDDECFIAFTSGSTGPAKAVSFTHAMVQRQASLLAEASGWQADMTVVMCFPGFIALALANGLTTVLPDMNFSRPAAANPQRIIEAIVDHGAECAFAAPVIWAKIAKHCQANRVQLDTLLHPVTAGAPVPIHLHAQLRDVIHPDGRLHTPYGATEAMPVTSTDTTALADTWEATRKGFGVCVGKPLTGIEVLVIRVTDEAVKSWSDELLVPVGEIGEIVVGGPVVSPEYKGDGPATMRAKIPRNGHVAHRMGDLGRLDAEGRVWYCGRVSHRIRTSAGMIATGELESIFDQHPRVYRTALVGVGGPGRQQPVICVEVERGERFSREFEQELAALAEGTPWAGVVETFLPHPGFPVDSRHNSKIRREELAAWAERVVGPGEVARK